MSTSMLKKLSMSEQHALLKEYRREKEKRVETYYKKAINLFPSDVKRVLDMGCGQGLFIELIQDEYFVVGSDFSRAALCYFKNQKTLNDISNSPFKNGSFDLITCLEVLEHLEQDTFIEAISEMKRVAKKYIMVSVPNEEPLEYFIVVCPACNCHFNSVGHIRAFTKNSLEKLFSPEFSLVALVETGDLREYPTYSKALAALRLYFEPKPPKNATCPQCGYKSEKGQNQLPPSNMPLARLGLKYLKSFADLVWRPKKKRRYLLALFKIDRTNEP